MMSHPHPHDKLGVERAVASLYREDTLAAVIYLFSFQTRPEKDTRAGVKTPGVGRMQWGTQSPWLFLKDS